MEDKIWPLRAPFEELRDVSVQRETSMHTDEAVTPATYGTYVGSPLLVNTFFPPKDQYCHLIP
jgi:hypothetical protein